MAWNTKIPHLRRFVLQNFPFIEEDFDALTDYQLICKVVEYLNTVITSQNEVIQQMINVTEDFEELETLFNQLKDYVDHYFDNLDVQEEINNKLDAMAEDGTLADIISEYLNSIAIFGYDSVASMKASENLVDGSYARTMGYYSANDGGGALYKIRAITNDDIVDEMFIIEMGDGTDELVAELVMDGVYIPEQLGAKGDGSADASSVFSAIFAKMEDNEKLEMTGEYLVSTPLYLPNKNNIVITGGTLKASDNFNGYVLNSNATAKTNISGTSTTCENMTIQNVFIDGSYKADGIYLDNYLRVKITGCTIHNIKNAGISLTSGHEAQIVNTNIIGKTVGYDDSQIISTGILLHSYDNIVDNCVIAYCQWAIDCTRKCNQITNCHFYCNRNGGGNVKLNKASFVTLDNNYYDGSGIYAINPWNTVISNSIFELSDNTNHIITLDLENASTQVKGLFINDAVVDDVRTNKTDIEFVTCNRKPQNSEDNNITNIRLASAVKLSNPYNVFALTDSESPIIVPNSFFRATNTSNTIGTHGSTDQFYNYAFNGNYIESEWVGESGYPWLFFKVVLPTKARISKKLIDGTTDIAIFASDETFIANNTATLEAGVYIVGVYRTAKLNISNL